MVALTSSRRISKPRADGVGVGVWPELVSDADPAPAFHAELDQGVVDVGDVGAVGDALDAAGPGVGDPLGVEDERERAVVEHLAGEGAQGHRLAAAGGGVDQDVRGLRVQVDGDDAAAGADADDGCGLRGLGHQLPPFIPQPCSRHLRAAGLGALADLGFSGLDNDVLDPVIVTGFHATRTHKLTPGQKTANRVLANGRAPAEHGFAHLKNWRVLTKLRTDPARASCHLPPATCAPCSSCSS
ncbi:transposase family protein [Streptomyces niger]|uniref:transposase family protein n=1 Tax=Streptomyces niger TaxID=66373 RepID=UPI001F341359|nr:transposase family protein [Streptomyces niger]